jgi:hypothetical protein
MKRGKFSMKIPSHGQTFPLATNPACLHAPFIDAMKSLFANYTKITLVHAATGSHQKLACTSLATQGGAFYSPMRGIDNDNGAIIGERKQSGTTGAMIGERKQSRTADPSSGTLGPTTAFEISQDSFSCETEEQANATMEDEEDNTTSSLLSHDSNETEEDHEFDDNGLPHTSSGVKGLHVMVE